MATIKSYKGHCVICDAATYGRDVCLQCSGEAAVDTYQHDGSIIHYKEPGIPAPIPGFYDKRM